MVIDKKYIPRVICLVNRKVKEGRQALVSFSLSLFLSIYIVYFKAKEVVFIIVEQINKRN